MSEPLRHLMNCPAETPENEDECSCGLYWRIQIQTAETLLAAWQKRAYEAEAELAKSRNEALEEAAKYCDGYGHRLYAQMDEGHNVRATAVFNAAINIRALKKAGDA